MLPTVHTTIFWHNTFGNVYRHIVAAFADLHIIEEWTAGGSMHTLSALLLFIDVHVNTPGYVEYVVYHMAAVIVNMDSTVPIMAALYYSWVADMFGGTEASLPAVLPPSWPGTKTLRCEWQWKTNWISKSIGQLQDHKRQTPPAQILHKNIVLVTAHRGAQLLYLCRRIRNIGF